MKAKTFCVTAFFLLNIYFVTGEPIQNRDFIPIECFEPYIGNITVYIGEAVELFKDAVNLGNVTVTSIKACAGSGTGSSSSESTGDGDISTCLLAAYPKIAKAIQDFIKTYEEVVPDIQKLKETITSCIDNATTNNKPTTTL